MHEGQSHPTVDVERLLALRGWDLGTEKGRRICGIRISKLQQRQDTGAAYPEEREELAALIQRLGNQG